MDTNTLPASGTNGLQTSTDNVAPSVTQHMVRLFFVISAPLWLAVMIRGISDWDSNHTGIPWLVVCLVSLFAVMLVTEGLVTRWLPWYPPLYFASQTVLIVVLLLRLPETDYFAALFVPLSAQVMLVFPKRYGYRWTALFAVITAVVLTDTHGFPSGVPFFLLYTGGFFFVSSYATTTTAAEQARRTSQQLVAELQAAYQELAAYGDQLRSLTIAEERMRVSRDLHDSVTQTLYGLTLTAEAASRNLSAGEIQTAAEQVHDLGDTARRVLQEMRLFIYELRPPIVERGGLIQSLQARLGAVEARSGLTATFDVDVNLVLTTEVEECFDRIAQEALNNVLKHSRAGSVVVRLHGDTEWARLEIIDDGHGFDPDSAEVSGGLGLQGMRERVAVVGGRLHIDSSPGKGTRVMAEVPL